MKPDRQSVSDGLEAKETEEITECRRRRKERHSKATDTGETAGGTERQREGRPERETNSSKVEKNF